MISFEQRVRFALLCMALISAVIASAAVAEPISAGAITVTDGDTNDPQRTSRP